MRLASAALVLAGGGLMAAGWEAHRRKDPDAIELAGMSFRITRSTEPEAITFNWVREDGGVAASVSGSTDTLCDPPSLMALDVDGDGARDTYYQHCGGHGYVTSRNSSLVDVNLGQFDVSDAPAVSTPWAREIRGGGWRLLTLGGVTLLTGLLGLVMARPRPGAGHQEPHGTA